MSTKTTNIILLGIGGQGALTMMEMLAMAAEKADEEVRVLSRVSLARLGNTGTCHIRLGPAASPSIPAGEADIVVSFEMSEVLRVLPMLRAGGTAFINLYRRLPIAAGVAGIHYPTRAEIEQALQARGLTGVFVPQELPVEETDDSPSLFEGRINMIMLGVLSGYTRLLPRPQLEEAIVERMPEFARANLRIFDAGWQFGTNQIKF